VRRVLEPDGYLLLSFLMTFSSKTNQTLFAACEIFYVGCPAVISHFIAPLPSCWLLARALPYRLLALLPVACSFHRA